MISFDRYPGGKHKALTMSYDDGLVQDLRLVKIFDEYGIKGTFHLNSGLLNEKGYMHVDDVPSVSKNHEVSAHGYTHQALSVTPKERMLNEIMNDRKKLEKITGYIIRGMSYPSGFYNDEVINIMSCAGIEYARVVQTTQGFEMPKDFMKWQATCHHKNNLMELGEEFIELPYRKRPLLMYVWGHSNEFDKDNNWKLIEDFCKTIGKRNDIWYATNIEIVDYVNAIKGLRFSADETIVYNPSSISVVISVYNEPVEIKGGEIVNI